ncbi:MAG: family 43 glycosylhydrolase [Labilibaculum sp.]|nr:family 43 glycosylhydrolase [Labilibaculum sp.]
MKKSIENFLIFSLVLLLFLSCSKKEAKTSYPNESSFCNPLNLNYRFQLTEPSRREAADPSVILFKNKYYMFLSKSGGYYVSDDLVSWSLIISTDLPIEEYAPTAVVMNDTVYFMAIDQKIYKSADPMKGKWQIAQDSLGIRTLDPALFLDDDGRLFLYHGLHPRLPIRGIELDAKTLLPIGDEVKILNTNKEIYGWERSGDYNNGTNKKPWLEGAWVTKHKGIYYMQYSVPGTQFKSYADAVYVSNSPLGPFQLAEHNPFSYKPEGFIAGAGHGSTFQDKYGNYWHAATMVIAVKNRLERRIGLFPAFFDKDGTFYTYTAYGDFPHKMPQKKMSGPEDYQPEWMMLSYNKPVEVSSALSDHSKEYAVNEDVRTYWSAETGDKGEWIMVDLQNKCKIGALQINFTEEGTTLLGRSEGIYYQYLLEYSDDKKNWKTLVDKTKNTVDSPHDYIELPNQVSARYVRLINYRVPDGKFAVSGFRIFGKGKGQLPKEASSFKLVRDVTDACNVSLTWEKVPDAVGYNIRYGTKPDKLYQNYQVYDSDSLTIHSLNSLQDYYFTIDAFNEQGITLGEKVLESKCK